MNPKPHVAWIAADGSDPAIPANRPDLIIDTIVALLQGTN